MLLLGAIHHGNRELMVELVYKKQVVNTANKFGVTPLHAAALHGDPEAVQLLLDAGAHRTPVD